MNAVSFLKEYKRSAIAELNTILESSTKELNKISPLLKKDTVILKNFMSGGKFLRGSLMFLGMLMAGCTKKRESVIASLSFEFMHAALLTQDDIIDKDTLRRGMPTVFKQFSNDHRAEFPKLKSMSHHYGISRAICLSDYSISLGTKLISDSSFCAKDKIHAVSIFHQCLNETSIGESLDVMYESLPLVNENQILLMHQYKSAFYTIVSPLKCGFALAGKLNVGIKKAIDTYGYFIGVAFQLRDDELGMFGDESKFGKFVGSDLQKRKNTLLIAKAFELGNRKQVKELSNLWGKQDLDKNDLKKAQDIIRDTGSLEYSQKLCQKFLKDGKRAIKGISKSDAYQNLLSSIADFVVNREV